ncbi:MAG: glycoside hydrolase family 15 protein [Nitriliruptorales bacterium]
MLDDLEAVVARIGDLRRWVLILDFDGTLSPAVDEPDEAVLPDAVKGALLDLAATTLKVAVLSSRPLDELEERFDRLPLLLVGGHGAEVRDPSGRRHALVDGETMSLPPRVVSEGEAVRWISMQHPGRTPIVVADDESDEEAFAAAADLGGGGVLVRERPRPTEARWRIERQDRVLELLHRLVAVTERPDILVETAPDGEDEREHPIEQYGLISDSRTAALVSPDGSIDWLCLPRFDSPSVFAALLDPERGGRWRIRPIDRELEVQRTYLGETNVLVTRFVRRGDPVLTLTDFLVYSRVNAFDATHTGHMILRHVECFAPVEAEVVFHPRFDYGRAHTTIERRDGGIRAAAGMDHLDLATDGVEWTVRPHRDGNGDVATATVRLRPGDERWFHLRTTGAERSPHDHLSPAELLDLTVRTWGRWSALIDYPDGPRRSVVIRSALVLKALVYEPTGALVAAPTTSLPETLGGERNWDYRHAWIRDSAYVLECFLRIGHAREAETFIRWLSELTDRIGGAEELRPLYRVTGEEDLTEFELPHLSGYRGSRPVRVGNGASSQLQLDIYGAAMQLGYLTERLGPEVPSAQWPVIIQLVETVRQRWQDPDSGLWEIRSAPRHHTFSKFQCWLAVDRAIRIGRDLGLRAPYDRWQKLADDIRDDVLANGYDRKIGAFTQAYGSTALDASVLALPLRGFLPPRDDRIRSTVARIREQLEVSDGLLLRYRSEDGLEGDEGAFLMCSFWLVELLARMGELDEAERVFDRLISMAGPLGLFAEEVDPVTHSHLGNYPQGFTHMGLIMAATAIDEERELRG